MAIEIEKIKNRKLIEEISKIVKAKYDSCR